LGPQDKSGWQIPDDFFCLGDFDESFLFVDSDKGIAIDIPPKNLYIWRYFLNQILEFSPSFCYGCLHVVGKIGYIVAERGELNRILVFNDKN